MAFPFPGISLFQRWDSGLWESAHAGTLLWPSLEGRGVTELGFHFKWSAKVPDMEVCEEAFPKQSSLTGKELIIFGVCYRFSTSLAVEGEKDRSGQLHRTRGWERAQPCPEHLMSRL